MEEIAQEQKQAGSGGWIRLLVLAAVSDVLVHVPVAEFDRNVAVCSCLPKMYYIQ